MKTILRLNQSVIDRIRAGEIIHQPYNAVKELLENSLDANASHIQIYLSKGGLDLIKLIDNGYGIKEEDLPLVCECHATSKLKEFKDLGNIETFGFRGEALASISQIANVTIVSKSRSSDHSYGYRACYHNGIISSTPKLCASNDGTIVTIQRLFDNTPIKKKVLKSPNEEEKYIIDVVKKYAIHNNIIGFYLKNENKCMINEIRQDNRIKRIEHIYGKDISNHLGFTKYTDSTCTFELCFSKIREFINKSNSNFILFVNNRLVDSSTIKKEINQVYNHIRVNYKAPFIYISIFVKPSDIDVNIHPTKNSVKLLNEEEIANKICTVLKRAVEESLPTIAVKKFKTSSNKPLSKEETIKHYYKPISINLSFPSSSSSSDSRSTKSNPKTPPRTLYSGIKKGNLNNYFQKVTSHGTPHNYEFREYRAPSTPIHISPKLKKNINNTTKKRQTQLYLEKIGDKGIIELDLMKKGSIYISKVNSNEELEEKENVQELESVLTIKSEIQHAESKDLSKIIFSHYCVNVIDDVISFIVSKEKYYLINYNVISEEFFYQIFINQMGEFGDIILSSPISIKKCIALFTPNISSQKLVQACNSILKHKELLASYYNIQVLTTKEDQEDWLTCLPMLLVNYIPSFDKLPIFLYNISTQIDWDNEIDCIDALARELSAFYCCCSKSQYNYFLSATRAAKFKAPKYLGDRGYVIEVNIPNEIISSNKA